MTDHGNRTAIYARAATQGQDAPNAALDRQIATCMDYCTAHGHAVVDRYLDAGYSGNTDRRPALQRLLQDAEARVIDPVIVATLDRLARSPRVVDAIVQRLEQYGISLVAVDEAINTATAEGRAMVRVLA